MQERLKNSGFSDWTPDRLPSLEGKTYFITGGNSGIGLEAAKMLVAAGGDVIITSRSLDKGHKAASEASRTGSGNVSVVQLDLTDMASIKAAAHDVRTHTDKLDGHINNAGIMQTPQGKTKDGFETQLGTNHLGHFLLTGLMFDLVKKASVRIVTVSSIAHKYGRINFTDLMLSENYSPTRAYTQSKLANLMFALELDRRLTAAGSTVTSFACHPGYSNTALQSTGPTGPLKAIYTLTNKLMAQPSFNGAIPTVLCAAGEEAQPGGYYGPQKMNDARGPVSDAKVTATARNEKVAARLWEESEKLVGFEWAGVLP